MNNHFYIYACYGERIPADTYTIVADSILCPDYVDTYTTIYNCCGKRLLPAHLPSYRQASCK